MTAKENKLAIEIAKLLIALKPQIADDYRASEDDDKPSMCVTVGTNDMETWSYQTGDNSFTGGCYGKRHWGVIYLYRRSKCLELAKYAVEEMAESFYQSQPENS